jgi:hypothetical protein
MHDATNAPIGDFENTPIFPQQGKIGSVSGLALLSLRERNRARSTLIEKNGGQKRMRMEAGLLNLW